MLEELDTGGPNTVTSTSACKTSLWSCSIEDFVHFLPPPRFRCEELKAFAPLKELVDLYPEDIFVLPTGLTELRWKTWASWGRLQWLGRRG